MKCIVPLAGPDLVHPDYGFRPMYPVDGRTLLEVAIEGRPWRAGLTGSDFTFVVREVKELGRLTCWLEATWPGCTIVRLPVLTGGAMFSALSGVALQRAEGEVLCIDLADILFQGDLSDPELLFVDRVGMIVPCFRSDDPCYSYLRTEDGQVVEAAEKRVISEHASAGVYFFKDRETYLGAASHAIRNADTLAVGGVHFICPMANGVIARGQSVLIPSVEDAEPIGKRFHPTDASVTKMPNRDAFMNNAVEQTIR
jgi:hypothetical protein